MLADDEHPDPRLDPYRGRAGQLSLNGAPVGHLLVESDFAVFKTGGALWWTRWAAPVEIAIWSTCIDTEVLDGQTLYGDELDYAIAQWGAGKHGDHDVTWLDDAESERVHSEVFGHQH